MTYRLGDGHIAIPEVLWEDIQGRLRWLDALEAAGVDSWSGYDWAVEILNEEED